jgi:hypothetical protein
LDAVVALGGHNGVVQSSVFEDINTRCPMHFVQIVGAVSAIV